MDARTVVPMLLAFILIAVFVVGAAGISVAAVFGFLAGRHGTGERRAPVARSRTELPSLAPAVVAPAELVEITAASGEPLARVARLPGNALAAGAPLPIHPGLRASLSPFLGPALQAMSAGVQVTSALRVVSVRFSPEVARMISSGAAQQMHSASTPGALRAVAQSADGRIVGNAELLSGTNWALLGTVAWQVAAIVTAQKFLVEINDKLAKITVGVKDLRDFLDDKEFSGLVADIRYLQLRASALGRGEVEFGERSVIATQLESIENRCNRCFSLCRRQLERRVHDVKKLQPGASSWWSTDESSQAVKAAIEAGSRQAAVLVMAAQVRLVAIRLRDSLHLNHQISAGLLTVLQDDVRDARHLWADFQSAVRGVSEGLSATFEWESTTKQQRDSVMHSLRENTEQMLIMFASVTKNAALESGTGSDLELLLAVDAKGEIIEASTLSK